MKEVGKAAKASGGMQGMRRTESEKEKTKMRERQRRAITTNIFHGLRKHGGYRLSPRADINEVLRELAKEAGWVVLPDGTTYRSFSSPHVTLTSFFLFFGLPFLANQSKFYIFIFFFWFTGLGLLSGLWVVESEQQQRNAEQHDFGGWWRRRRRSRVLLNHSVAIKGLYEQQQQQWGWWVYCNELALRPRWWRSFR
jgi:hypothetical protein